MKVASSLLNLKRSELLAEGKRESYLLTNLPRRLTKLRERLTMMQKGLYHFRRCAASHIFVIMISTEGRTKKAICLRASLMPV